MSKCGRTNLRVVKSTTDKDHKRTAVIALYQGRRHNFQSGGTNIAASEASRNFFGVIPPHSRIQQLQREPIGQRFPGICLLQYFLLVMHYTINIPNDLQDSTNRRQKECCAAQKAKYCAHCITVCTDPMAAFPISEH